MRIKKKSEEKVKEYKEGRLSELYSRRAELNDLLTAHLKNKDDESFNETSAKINAIDIQIEFNENLNSGDLRSVRKSSGTLTSRNLGGKRDWNR